MEKGVDLLMASIVEQFSLDVVDIKTYSPLTLAYIGDGIYELIIRTLLIKQGNSQVNKLHKKASLMVKASAQSAIAESILPFLTEGELSVYKRGRNAKSATMAKNATMSDYRRATGIEALMGHLYLNGEYGRMISLMKKGLEESGLYKATHNEK